MKINKKIVGNIAVCTALVGCFIGSCIATSACTKHIVLNNLYIERYVGCYEQYKDYYDDIYDYMFDRGYQDACMLVPLDSVGALNESYVNGYNKALESLIIPSESESESEGFQLWF